MSARMHLRPDSRRVCGLVLAALFVLATSALAGAARAEAAPASSDEDPWEPVNRRIFWFNEQLDNYLLEPVARGWDWVMPEFVQGSLDHFFNNVHAPIATVNALLQGKPRDAGVEMGRFIVNSTVGFAGFFDPARSELGLKDVREDFGQTLAVWGLDSGPYLVLPILGPSSPRDTLGMGVDAAMAAYTWFIPWFATVSARGVDVVNTRARLLQQIEDSRKSSFDYYVFVRNAFLQYRRALIDDKEGGPKGGLYENLYDVDPGE
jgi:phospholipid-binding lipoprotein MlaA